MRPYVVPLATVAAGDLGVAGGKGANLGELIQAGFAVPDGFVVSTRLYRDAVNATGVSGSDDAALIRAAIEALTIAPPLAVEIVDAYRELGGGPVAVRSSATAEDLPGAAFAGQQETFLHVIGAEAVLEAVRGCWASLWGDRAVAYRARVGYSGEPEIAVVVQQMVPSEFAGVLFTADPVSGRRDEVVIESSPGLGEAVVSGLVTPEQVVVDRRGRIRDRRPGRREIIIGGQESGGVVHTTGGDDPGAELAARTLIELAGVGARIEEHFGRPQDIEWAYADATMWVVQARPLTALPPAPVKVNRVQRVAGAVAAELVPTRPYPLDITAWTVPGWFTILARMVAEIPAVALDVQQMFPTTDGVVDQLLPPDLHLTWRTLTTPLRIRHQLHRCDPARWTLDPRFDSYEHRLQELRTRDHTTMAWSGLMAVPGEVLDLLNDYVDIRIEYLPAASVSIVRLRVLLTLLGLSSQFWTLLAGQPTQTQAGNDALDAIAQLIRRTPGWTEAFSSLPDDDLVRAVWNTPEFAPLRVALSEWLASYGHRETTSAALISSPTWEDNPLLLLTNLRGLVAHPATRAPGPDRAMVAEQRIRRRRWVRLTRTGASIGRTAAAARAGMVFREDSHFHALRLRPVLRSALLEAGSRLSGVGALAQPEDVFHLELAELQGLPAPDHLGAEQRDRLQHLVGRRTVRRAAFGEAPLISPATLYPKVRRPARNVLVRGTPSGGGRATGTVRVIKDPAEFGQLRLGDVLVCPYTNPAWTPLFQTAAAVVCDSGSFGSHAAIVAREYGIPAVMGTGNGTQVLRRTGRGRRWSPGRRRGRQDGSRRFTTVSEPSPALSSPARRGFRERRAPRAAGRRRPRADRHTRTHHPGIRRGGWGTRSLAAPEQSPPRPWHDR